MQLFTHPSMLMALLALPVLSVIGFFAARGRRQALVQFAGLTGAVVYQRRTSRLAGLAASLGLTFLALGMAGPRWGRDWDLSAAPGRDLLVVLDVSRSMYAEAPSRLELACGALEDLAQTLRRRGGQRVGLILFAGKARLVCPLTHDLDHFTEILREIDWSVPDVNLGAGTRIGAGLALALESFEGRSAAARDVLLISDGDDPARDGEWRQGVEQARAEGVALQVLGIGDSGEGHRIPEGKGWVMYEGQPIVTRREEAPLRAIAQRTGGELFLASGRTYPLGERYLALAAARAREEDSPDALPLPRQRQEWFLVPALVLLASTLILLPRGGRR